MRYFFALNTILLVSAICFSAPNYSNSHFQNRSFLEDKFLSGEHKDLIIKNSNFYQERKNEKEIPVHIFPEDMSGVVFIDCNLDNVYIPKGNTVIGGSNRLLLSSSDGDWECSVSSTTARYVPTWNVSEAIRLKTSQQSLQQ